MNPIDLFHDALESMLKAHGLTSYSTFAIWDIYGGTGEKTGYGVIARQPFTLRQAQDVAIALSMAPGPFFVTVEQRKAMPIHSEFLFHYHATGSAHEKLTAIAAMQAALVQPASPAREEWVPA